MSQLKVNSYATIEGLRGQQFGKEVYTALLQFKDLRKFLEVFPEVQRSASGRKISSMKTYILSGLEEGNMRFFSGITASARGHVFYDEKSKMIAIDTIHSKLSLNDGQHRFYSVSEVIEDYHRKLQNKNLSQSKKEEILSKVTMLEEMVIPIMIFNNISIAEESQLFYDLNNLQSRPSRSATIRLAQRDQLSVLARMVCEHSKALQKYGVEYNKMTIHKNNPNFVLLTTVYESIKFYYKKELRANKNFITDENIQTLCDEVVVILDKVFEQFPKNFYIKGSTVLAKGFALRGIMQFVSEELSKFTRHEDIFGAIRNVDWREDINVWGPYGALEQQSGLLVFPGHNSSGAGIIKQALKKELQKLELIHN